MCVYENVLNFFFFPLEDYLSILMQNYTQVHQKYTLYMKNVSYFRFFFNKSLRYAVDIRVTESLKIRDIF